MSSKIFNIGDVVELKSGSPKMTVDEVTQQYDKKANPLDAYDCKCIYFVDDKYHQLIVDQHSLVKSK
jgi:uncharacterized protein YodC (DUF2158 family)